MESLMYPVLRPFALLLLSLTFGHTEQIFIDPESYPLATRSLSEQYCARGKREDPLCQSHTLSYIDSNVSGFPSFMRGVSAYITPYLKEYRESDPKKEVLGMLKEFHGDLSGEWYDKNIFGLFAKSPSTYTLSLTSSGYSGGAHGYYGISYTNIAIASQKKISLSTLFVPGSDKRLHTTARSWYKLAHNLQPSQPLTDDDWFEDKFVLPDNFAITPYGLYFLYGQYEIKAYAYGLTSFFLPYSAVAEIIDPKGPLAFALTSPKDHIEASFSNTEMRLSLSARQQGDQVTVSASLLPLAYADRAWLSVSLPQIDTKKALLSTGYKHFDHTVPYDRSNKIYNGAIHKTIHAKYLLVEADKRNPEYRKRYTMQFRVKVPPSVKVLIIDIRATLQKGKKSDTLPPEYEGITGQQGYKNYRILLPLHRQMKK